MIDKKKLLPNKKLKELMRLVCSYLSADKEYTKKYFNSEMPFSDVVINKGEIPCKDPKARKFELLHKVVTREDWTGKGHNYKMEVIISVKAQRVK